MFLTRPLLTFAFTDDYLQKQRALSSRDPQDGKLESKEVITRDEKGFLVRRKVLVRRYTNTPQRVNRWKEYRAAQRVQALWRGVLTRKWLREIEKDADDIVNQIGMRKEPEEEEKVDKGAFKDRPIADFWKNVIEEEPSTSLVVEKKKKKKGIKRQDTRDTFAQTDEISALVDAIKQTPRKPPSPSRQTRLGTIGVKNHTAATLMRLSQIAAIYRTSLKADLMRTESREGGAPHEPKYAWNSSVKLV